MTVTQELAYQRRIDQLEDALEGYMRVMGMTDSKVTGDLREGFLQAYCECLVALPRYKRAAPLGSQRS